MKQAAVAALITALKNDEKFVARLAFLAEQNGSDIIEDACDTIVTKVLIDTDEIKDFIRSQFPGVTIDHDCHVELSRGKCEGIRVFGRLHAFRSESERYSTPWYQKERYSLEATEEMPQAFDTSDWHTFPLNFFPEDMYAVKTL